MNVSVTDNQHPNDTPMRRVLFVEMSVAEQDAWLDAVRARRLVVLEKKKDKEKERAAIADARIAAQIDKANAMLAKEIDALDRALEKVEKRVTLIRALTHIGNADEG